MSAHTERRLDGHKLFISRADDNVELHAVTNGRPVTRLVYVLSPDEAREIARDLLSATGRLTRDRSHSEIVVNYGPAPDNFGAGLAAGFEEGRRHGRK